MPSIAITIDKKTPKKVGDVWSWRFRVDIASMQIWFTKNSPKVLIDRQIFPGKSLDGKGLSLSPRINQIETICLLLG